MRRTILMLLGIISHLHFQAYAEPILGTSYVSQQGTQSSGTTVTHFDSTDFVTYASVDFSDPGTTKGIMLNYAKGNENHSLEIRLGGPTGDIIAEFSPGGTQGWNKFVTAYIGIEDVDGIHDVTFVGRGGNGVLNLAWFELSDFADRAAIHSRIDAPNYSNQKGIIFAGSVLGYFDKGDFVTYSQINFGSPGTTDGIRLRYAKGNNGGRMEVRLGGPSGDIIAEINPATTGGWGNYMDAYLGIEGVSGVHDVTFVGFDTWGVMNIDWFEPSIRNNVHPRIDATAYSRQYGLQSDSKIMGYFDNNDFITYSNLNFGTDSITKSILLSYAKANTGGKMEVRVNGAEGPIIGEFIPQNTGGWGDFETVYIPISAVEGINDLTFVGRDVHGVLNLEWFEFSEDIVFNVATDYKVDDENGVDVQCSYTVVRDAFIDQVYNVYYLDSGVDAETMFYRYMGARDGSEAAMLVTYLCESAQEDMAVDAVNFDEIVYDEGSQFIELHYSGRGSWNEETETLLSPSDGETPAQRLKDDAYQVNYYKTVSEKKAFKMPDLPQFDPSKCASHTAQCCWPRDRQANDNNGNCNSPYDSDCVDKDVADNTDLCYNELDKAPYANNIVANGFSVYGDEGPIHCHGFAWSPDQTEITTRYRANALFFVSMFDHMYTRGYVENIPGSPMCGCVEHMPVVTRSDCTQTNVKEYYTFRKSNDGHSSVINGIALRYQACQGANNQNNDLRAFVQQLVNDGKLSEAEQKIVNSRLVGKKNCPSAIDNLIESKGFKKGHEVNEDQWTFIVGEGFDDEKPLLDYRVLNEMMEAQGDVQIVRRVCPSCKQSHRDIYYRRLTSIPDGFNLLDTLMNNWFDENNQHNVDFALYSTHLDAYLDTNRWTFCNFNDPGIGFPRDCGPTGFVPSQWNSYWRTNGGDANYHAFMVPANPSFKSKIDRPTLATFLGTDFSPLWKGIQTSGTTVTHFDKNDYFTYPLVNFGDPGTTKGIMLNYAKGNENHSLEIRLGGPTGDIIAEFSPGGTQGWNKFVTAYIGIEDVDGIHDVTFVGRGGNGVLNLAWFELSDFADRAAIHSRIDAPNYSNQKGIIFAGSVLGYFDKGDFVTYSQINFGSPGATDGIRLRYAKGNNGGRMEVRLGGPSGDIIAEINPATTGGWGNYMDAYLGIEGVSGVHDVTFVGFDTWGVMNIDWFELDQQE